jgi:hypothetical protein
VWRGGGGEKSRRMNMVQTMFTHECKFKKMIPVETVPGILGWRAVGGRGNSNMMYLIHCKNLCKCHNVPTPSTTIKIKIKKQKQECPRIKCQLW